MAEEGAVATEQLTQSMTVLRKSAALFVPHRDGEIESLLRAAPVAGGELQETSELRAIRESVTRVRMTDALQLPNEAEWIDTLTRQLVAALRAQWNETIPDDEARARSNWVFGLLDARGWVHRAASDFNGCGRTLPSANLDATDFPRRACCPRKVLEVARGLRPREFKDEQPQSYAELLTVVREMVDQEVAQTLPKGGHR